MYSSIIFRLRHLSDQTGICTGQHQKCLENVRCPTVISCSAGHQGENPKTTYLTNKRRTKITQHGTNIYDFIDGVPHGGTNWGS